MSVACDEKDGSRSVGEGLVQVFFKVDVGFLDRGDIPYMQLFDFHNFLDC